MDADDYDVSDKTFAWDESSSQDVRSLFRIAQNTGNITMVSQVPDGQYVIVSQVGILLGMQSARWG